MGAGFDHPPNAQYLTLRFFRLIKVNNNRSVQDVVSFAEYRSPAHKTTQAGNALFEYRSWLCQLKYDSEDDVDEAATPSQSSQLQEEPVDVIERKDSAGSVAGIKRHGEEDWSACLSPATRPGRETG